MQLPSDTTVFSLKENGAWEFRFSEKYSTGLEFTAAGTKRLEGLVAYSYRPESGEYNLRLFIYPNPNNAMFGFVSVEGQYFFPFDLGVMKLAESMGPQAEEMHLLQIPLLEGFCLHYLLFQGVSFREIIKLEPEIGKELAKKIRGFRDYWRYFFLFDPKDLAEAMEVNAPVAASLHRMQIEGRSELELLLSAARSSPHCAKYHAQKWLELKAKTTDEVEKKLAETAALLFEGEPLKIIAATVWHCDSERPEKFVSDKRSKIVSLAERHGLEAPPKSGRGAKKKKNK